MIFVSVFLRQGFGYSNQLVPLSTKGFPKEPACLIDLWRVWTAHRPSQFLNIGYLLRNFRDKTFLAGVLSTSKKVCSWLTTLLSSYNLLGKALFPELVGFILRTSREWCERMVIPDNQLLFLSLSNGLV